MRKIVLANFKKFLTNVGARSKTSTLHNLQMVVNYMKLGRWMRQNGYWPEKRLATRWKVFDSVADRVRNDRVLYLEFGVFEGRSMRHWSKALKNPDSKLHGFDSFEGLPEDFDDVEGVYQKGHFDVGGRIPKIDDPRVEFFRGWFDQTLPHYRVPDHDVLVMTLDADLYSSTIHVLNHFREHIVPGTYIYFDDMSRPDHEPRAFREFMDDTGYEFELVSADSSLNTAFFRRVS